MSNLIPADGYVAVFSRIDSDGETQFHSRPLICWTVGEDGLAAGQYLTSQGRVAVASDIPNFTKYATADGWEAESMRLAYQEGQRRQAERAFDRSNAKTRDRGETR